MAVEISNFSLVPEKIADCCRGSSLSETSNLVDAARAINLDLLQGGIIGQSTFNHEIRVATLVGLIAKEMGMSQEERAVAGAGALLHDTGKINIPEKILDSKRSLTAEEWAKIKTHPISGYDLLRSVGFPENVCLAALEHHEKFTGRGYPQGISGESISSIARIVAVADFADVGNTRRPGSRELNFFIVERQILGDIICGGRRFDPPAALACIKVLNKFAIASPKPGQFLYSF